MVGTLRAASENDKQNVRCTQRPYIAEWEQIQDDEVGLKRKTENYYIIPPPRVALTHR